MNTVIIFYSYTGNAKQLALKAAETEQADIIEVKDKRRPGTIKAYTVGCFAALRGKGWDIQPIKTDLSAYDKLIIYSPVWAGNPAPAINVILNSLPSGKAVEIRMVSASGGSGCKERIQMLIESKGSKLTGFEDIKS